MKKLEVTNTILINASASTLWDVLTKPEYTKRYMFGCETVSEWKVGSELLWKGSYEGKEMIFVKGHIKEMVPHTKLVYSTFDPNAAMADISENYTDVTYLLLEENGVTTLTASQGDFAKVADGERRFKEVSNNGEGWNPILVEIKKVAEEINYSLLKT